MGFEPTTVGLEVQCSVQLRYEGVKKRLNYINGTVFRLILLKNTDAFIHLRAGQRDQHGVGRPVDQFAQFCRAERLVAIG